MKRADKATLSPGMEKIKSAPPAASAICNDLTSLRYIWNDMNFVVSMGGLRKQSLNHILYLCLGWGSLVKKDFWTDRRKPRKSREMVSGKCHKVVEKERAGNTLRTWEHRGHCQLAGASAMCREERALRWQRSKWVLCKNAGDQCPLLKKIDG